MGKRNLKNNICADLERLVALGKLWANVAIFHPRLAYQDIDWNQAFVQAVEQLQELEIDYLSVVQAMLAVLGDGATYAYREQSYLAADEPALKERQLVHVEGTVAVFDLQQLYGEELEAIRQGISRELDNLTASASASAVLFDLRKNGVALFAINSIFDAEISSRLTAELIVAPAKRSRIYSGLAAGSNDSYYHSAFQVKDAQVFYPHDKHLQIPVYFLIDQSSQLPTVALALHGSSNLGGIISDGEYVHLDVATACTTFNLPDQTVVNLRLEEYLFSDGRTEFVPDKIIPRDYSEANDDIDNAFPAAVKWISEEQGNRLRAHSLSAGRLLEYHSYPECEYPGKEHRMLAAFRIWSIIEYFFPYKNLIDRDWDQVLLEMLPAFVDAANACEYALAVSKMVSRIDDSHGFISCDTLDRYFGLASPAVRCRMIEGRPVIAQVADQEYVNAAGLKIGDTVVSIDGVPFAERFGALAKYIASSTLQSRQERLARIFLHGDDCSTLRLEIETEAGIKKIVSLPRKCSYKDYFCQPAGGKEFYLLSNSAASIGYVDLGLLTLDMVDEMFEAFKKTKSIIFDMRGYPKGTGGAIAERLCQVDGVAAARFVRPIVAIPFSSYSIYDSVEPQVQIFVQRVHQRGKPRYEGKTVMLMDARTQSQAEQMGLFLKAANGTVFIGSATAGANGAVTDFFVPGEICISFSGDAIEYPDRRQLQRVGLQPDILVRPTIKGLREGRDEVLDAAIEYLSNP